MPDETPASERQLPMGPNPFEDRQPADAEKPEALPMPMAKPNEEVELELSIPIPSPPLGQNAAYHRAKPYMRVAEVQEWDTSMTVPASHVPLRTDSPQMKYAPNFREPQTRDRSRYSKPWADALGLPNRGE